MERITRSDIEIRIAYANVLLAEHGSNRRLVFSRYNDYYKIEEHDMLLDRIINDYYYNGSIRECYTWLIAFNRALNMTRG